MTRILYCLDSLDENEAEDLDRHMVDYSIGYDVIYAAFSWSVAEEAYGLMRALAQKHKVGLFDVGADEGDIILPDGTMIKKMKPKGKRKKFENRKT